MKNTETIILRLINKLGKLSFKTNKKDDLQKHTDFMLAQTGALQSGKPVYVKATYEIVSEMYVKFFTRRAHLHAYIRTMIKDGYAPFTESIAGKNKDEKADTLYHQLKSVYCSVHTCEPFSLSDSQVGKKDKMTYDEAIKRCEWMINNLMEAHEKITGEVGEAWTIPAWRDDE